MSKADPIQVRPDRKDNLFEPVARDHAAHGSSDDAVDSSAELWISEHKKGIGIAALGASTLVGAGFMLASRKSSREAGSREKTTGRR